MPNIAKLMKQAADMQRNFSSAREELAAKELSFSAGGGAVEVSIHGDGTIYDIRISPEAAAEPDMLSDLVLSAVRGAQGKAKELESEMMGRLTAGLRLPPGFSL